MKDKIKQYLQEIFSFPKKKNYIIRKNIFPIVKDVNNIIWKDDSLYSINNDAMIFLDLPESGQYFKIISQIKTNNRNLSSQLFYKNKDDENFIEKNFIWLGNTDENLKINYFNAKKLINEFRLNPINRDGKFSIEYFEIIKISMIEFYILKYLYLMKQIYNKIYANPYIIKKFFVLLKKEGLRKSLKKVSDFLNKKANNCYEYKTPVFSKEIENNIKNFSKKPLVSIIMPVYNVDVKWLDLAIKSVKNQWYENWELCIVDDASIKKETKEFLQKISHPKIKIRFLEKNKGIAGASNEALKLASGEYIVLMDNDDEITPDALYEIVKVINEKDAEFIYSDEDFIDINGHCSNPHFKPDFSPDLLLSHNYITHLVCFKKELLEKSGKFREEFNGSQDYDLFLRLTEVTEKIYHIPKVLYHWRTLESSTSINVNAKPEAVERSKRLLEETLKRRNINGRVEYGNLPHYFRVRYNINDNPLVSIIIPFKDKPELLKMCINSILNKSTYKNFEIIGVSNNSQDKKTFEIMNFFEKSDKRVKFYEYNIDFNYAKINNYAVKNFAKGEHILLLNNDIEVIEPSWIEAMLEHSQRKEIGCVGAKLYYPNDTIQHAGIIIGLGGYAGHSHKMYKRNSYGYFNRLNIIQNVSAVTGACLMVKKDIYQEVNGMDEIRFKVAYNDVDFCLRVREKGYLNIFTPYAELYHHESLSRGYEITPEKMARFQKEKDALYERHKKILEKGDPYYNPNLTLDKEDFSIKGC